MHVSILCISDNFSVSMFFFFFSFNFIFVCFCFKFIVLLFGYGFHTALQKFLSISYCLCNFILFLLFSTTKHTKKKETTRESVLRKRRRKKLCRLCLLSSQYVYTIYHSVQCGIKYSQTLENRLKWLFKVFPFDIRISVVVLCYFVAFCSRFL